MSDNSATIDPAVTARPRKRSGDQEQHVHATPACRQKRQRYVSQACNECKKRKIKCSGGVVCRHCESHDVPCEYAHHDYQSAGQTIRTNFARMQGEIDILKSQVTMLLSTVKQLQDQRCCQSPVATSNDGDAVVESTHVLEHRPRYSTVSTTSKTPRLQFPGPTSSAFSFGVASSTLSSMGLNSDINDNEEVGNESNMTTRIGTPRPDTDVIEHTDPLHSLSTGDILRLLRVYDDEVNSVYPCIDVVGFESRLCSSFDNNDSGTNSWTFTNGSLLVTLFNTKEIRLLKMIVATALVLEGMGESDLGQKLVDDVERLSGRTMRHKVVDSAELQILTVLSVYYFHSDEEILAWRAIGMASRMALEMGLHKKEGLVHSFLGSRNQGWLTKLFWCIYVLDRRWSFGLGMPFALQDSDIDPELPTPGSSVPYLKCLVAYGKLSSKVWQAIAGFDCSGKGTDRETTRYLEFQMQDWIHSIPEELRLISSRPRTTAEERCPVRRRLRVLLHVRGNHMRILIHRHNVLSATNIARNLERAHMVIDIAKDTIRVLVNLNKTSNIYSMQQNAFNYFLVSALAAVFLAVCHAPAEFGHACRNEFYDALDLVKRFSTRSSVSRRLWKSVRKLRYVGSRLGLAANDDPIDTDRTAQLPACLSNGTELSTVDQSFGREPIDNPLARDIIPDSLSNSSTTGCFVGTDPFPVSSTHVFDMGQISDDLTSFFEAFGNSDTIRHFNIETSQDGHDLFSVRDGSEVSRLFEGLM